MSVLKEKLLQKTLLKIKFQKAWLESVITEIENNQISDARELYILGTYSHEEIKRNLKELDESH